MRGRRVTMAVSGASTTSTGGAPATPPPPAAPPRRRLRLHGGREFGTFAGLLVLSAVLWIATPYFATVPNLVNVV